jgi:hypothetical protein
LPLRGLALLAAVGASVGADQAAAGHIVSELSTAVQSADLRSHWGEADGIQLWRWGVCFCRSGMALFAEG